MGQVINVTREEMRLMSSLDRGVSYMRAKGDPRYNTAIEKQRSLRKEILKDIIEKVI